MPSAGHKAKVLLVDDEPNILMALSFLVAQQGFEVLMASNGEEGLTMAVKHEPDILVLDVMMPGMNGFEVARRLREYPNLDHVRIIFLTARGTQADRLEGYDSGGEVYITKPFDNDHLVNTINEVYEFG